MKGLIIKFIMGLVVGITAITLCFNWFGWRLFLVLLLWQWGNNIMDGLNKKF